MASAFVPPKDLYSLEKSKVGETVLTTSDSLCVITLLAITKKPQSLRGRELVNTH